MDEETKSLQELWKVSAEKAREVAARLGTISRRKASGKGPSYYTQDEIAYVYTAYQEALQAHREATAGTISYAGKYFE